MALTQEEFDNLVHQLEGYACQHPKRFQQRVTLLALMGYGYILLTLSLLLWIVVSIGLLRSVSVQYGSVWIGCALVIALVLIGTVVRSIWVNIPKPQGKKLRRKEIPQLFNLVNELATTLDTPKFHNILLTQELNAAVVQVPRLGIFGWFQNYLILGLPLMQALSLEEFRAIIAHELGHLSGRHSRFLGWIYQIRQAWIQLLKRLHKQQKQSSSGLWIIDTLVWVANGLGWLVFGLFFEWFVSKFSAYSFVLMRTYEYEADKYSADLTGTQNLANALIKMTVKTRYLNRSFWCEIYKQADYNPEIPDAILLMFDALRTEIPAEGKERWLKAALAQKTDTSDTHPCLSERLQALGHLADATYLSERMAVTKSAAEELFSTEILDKLTLQLNEEWQKANIGFWRNRFKYLQEINPTLLELEEKAKKQPLTFEEKWNLCKWTAEVKGSDAAISLLQDLLAERSYYAPANHLLGKILLEKNDMTGISYLEKAVSCDMEMTVPSYQLVYDFLYYEQGDTEKLKYYQNEVEQYYYRRLFYASGVFR